MSRVLVLGATGMLGDACFARLRMEEELEVVGSARRSTDKFVGIDVGVDDVALKIQKLEPNWVINCIGLIKPHIDNNSSQSIRNAIHINSLLPFELSRVAEGIGAKVIQIATDCVFSGRRGSYSEEDFHDALDIYGKTKSLGEVSTNNMMHIRCSIVGPEHGRSTSLLEWFKNQPTGSRIKGFLDHKWNGITSDHFARVCSAIIKTDAFEAGVQHLIPSDIVNKATLLHYFALAYDRPDITIEPINTGESVDRSLTTKKPGRNQALWSMAGYSEIPTIEQMIREQARI